VPLPFDLLASRCEDIPLPRDELVQFVGRQVGHRAVPDEATMLGVVPQYRAVPLDAPAHRHRIGHVAAQLRIVGCEQRDWVESWHGLS